MDIKLDSYYGAVYHLEIPAYAPKFGHGAGGNLMAYYFRPNSTERPTEAVKWILMTTFRYFNPKDHSGNNDSYDTKKYGCEAKTEDEVDRALYESILSQAFKYNVKRFECLPLRTAGINVLSKIKAANKSWLMIDDANTKYYPNGPPAD